MHEDGVEDEMIACAQERKGKNVKKKINEKFGNLYLTSE